MAAKTPTFRSYLDQFLSEQDLTAEAIAELCAVTAQAVSLWRTGERKPNVANARMIHREYGIPLFLLRPDLWDPPPNGLLFRRPRRAARRKARAEKAAAAKDGADDAEDPAVFAA